MVVGLCGAAGAIGVFSVARLVPFFAGLGGAAAIDVELGRGSAELPELLGALEEFDYRGWATVERRNSPRPVEDCADAVAYLRAL